MFFLTVSPLNPPDNKTTSLLLYFWRTVIIRLLRKVFGNKEIMPIPNWLILLINITGWKTKINHAKHLESPKMQYIWGRKEGVTSVYLLKLLLPRRLNQSKCKEVKKSIFLSSSLKIIFIKVASNHWFCVVWVCVCFGWKYNCGKGINSIFPPAILAG